MTIQKDKRCQRCADMEIIDTSCEDCKDIKEFEALMSGALDFTALPDNDLGDGISFVTPEEAKEYYGQGVTVEEKQALWPSNERIDAIGQNGPTGEHYKKCLHKSCDQCGGTGTKKSGEMCVHFISCPCPKCTPYYMSTNEGMGV